MTITKFIFFVTNVQTTEDPYYKAICINGYGHGYGRNIDDAIKECFSQVNDMVYVCRDTNIPLDLISKEMWIKTENAEKYNIDSWTNPNIKWIEFDINNFSTT